MKAIITKFYADTPVGAIGEIVKRWNTPNGEWMKLDFGRNLSGQKLQKSFPLNVLSTDIGEYDGEIHIGNDCFNWQRSCPGKVIGTCRECGAPLCFHCLGEADCELCLDIKQSVNPTDESTVLPLGGEG